MHRPGQVREEPGQHGLLESQVRVHLYKEKWQSIGSKVRGENMVPKLFVALLCSAAKIEPPLNPEALSGLIKLKLAGPGGNVKLFNEILALCPGLIALTLRKSGLVTYSVLKQVTICPCTQHPLSRPSPLTHSARANLSLTGTS